MKKIDWFEQTLRQWCQEHPKGVSAQEMAQAFQLDRSTASRYLNQLVQKGVARKIIGRPVRYVPVSDASHRDFLDLPWMEEAMAALLYPPNGLPLLLTGATGVGKSYLAKQLVEIAIRKGHLPEGTPFILFNCAEYAQNPELLLGQLFGVKKGAYTGAEKEKPGLIDRANQGVLFLDEIHRLPPAGQEMLFTLIDQGIYRRLGETALDRTAHVRLIGATTENPNVALLPTLQRRFSVKIEIPPLSKRSKNERLRLLQSFLQEESKQMKLPLSMTEECRQRFLNYDFPGNIGQLKSDVQIACARAFLRNMYAMEKEVIIQLHDLPAHLRQMPLEQEKWTSSTDSVHPSMNQTNIYDLLRQRKESLLQQNIDGSEFHAELLNTVNSYIQQLIQTAKSQEASEALSSDLFQRLKEIAVEMGTNISDTQLEALAYHLQAVIHSSSHLTPSLPVSWNHVGDVSYTPLIQKIAKMIKNEWKVTLPKEELILMNLLLNYQDQPYEKKPLILTVCLTGEGAAVSLKMWLKEQLPSTYQDVEIFPLEIDPFTRKSPQLTHWKESYQLIAIVGTVPPLTDEIPYIPIWELYQPHGFKRLLQLLEQSDDKHTDETELSFAQIPKWIETGLEQSVTHYNPKRFVQILYQFAPRFRAFFKWDAEREIGLWMHLGIYTDQILRQELKKKPDSLAEKVTCRDQLPHQAIQLWEELLHQLQTTFLITYPSQAAYEMARLSMI